MLNINDIALCKQLPSALVDRGIPASASLGYKLREMESTSALWKHISEVLLNVSKLYSLINALLSWTNFRSISNVLQLAAAESNER